MSRGKGDNKAKNPRRTGIEQGQGRRVSLALRSESGCNPQRDQPLGSGAAGTVVAGGGVVAGTLGAHELQPLSQPHGSQPNRLRNRRCSRPSEQPSLQPLSQPALQLSEEKLR